MGNEGARILICGRQGQGKSNLALALLWRALLDNISDRYYVIDLSPKFYRGFASSPGLIHAGFKLIRISTEDLDRYDSLSWAPLFDRYKKAVFYLDIGDEKDIEFVASELGHEIGLRGYSTVLVDEAAILIDRYSHRHGLRSLVIRGRERGIKMICVTQFPTESNSLLIKGSNSCISFQAGSVNDAKKLEYFFGSKYHLLTKLPQLCALWATTFSTTILPIYVPLFWKKTIFRR